VESISNKFREALRGIRTGLHSFRKSAVQRVAEVMGDVLAASIWVGHGNGSGDLSTTQNYLNKSQRRMDEINEKLSNVVGY
jgi:L-aminopeptidase/D-esterase-like protein